MSCLSSDRFSVRFLTKEGNNAFEFYPKKIRLMLERRKLDFARIEGNELVRDELHSQVVESEGIFNRPTAVQILLDGDVIRRMYFRPDFASFNADGVHIKVKDPQVALSTSEIDEEWSAVKLRKAYTHVFEEWNQDENSFSYLIKGLKFSPEDLDKAYFSESMVDGLRSGDLSSAVEIKNTAQNIDGEIINGKYKIDLDRISPLESIWELNEQFQVETWVDAEGYLWVGTPTSAPNYHLAANDDSRIWRLQKANITHPRTPIRQVVVNGAWVDNPNVGEVGNDIVQTLNPGDNTKDKQTLGIATRTDVDFGDTFSYHNGNITADSIDKIAEKLLREKIKDSNAGRITVVPSQSGTEATTFESLSLGDFIRVIPEDDRFLAPDATSGDIEDYRDYGVDRNCRPLLNEEYIINGITYRDGDGDYLIDLDVVMASANLGGQDIETEIRYYDPTSKEYSETPEAY